MASDGDRTVPTGDRVPLASCFYHFGEFVVPPDTANPRVDPGQKCLVGHFTGLGEVQALCYRTTYHGVWFGFEVDDHPLVLAHNGHCLQNMGLIGAAGAGMPYYLPYFNGPDDLSLACRSPIPFNRSFRLWMGNSHRDDAKSCFGLHVYVRGTDIEPAEGNLTDWSVVTPERPRHTAVSAETITLSRWGDESVQLKGPLDSPV